MEISQARKEAGMATLTWISDADKGQAKLILLLMVGDTFMTPR